MSRPAIDQMLCHLIWNIHLDIKHQDNNLKKGSLEAELGHLWPGVVVGEAEHPVAGHKHARGEGQHPGGQQVHQVQGPPAGAHVTKDWLTWWSLRGAV